MNREAELLAAMPHATLDEQRKIMAELNQIRASARSRAQDDIARSMSAGYLSHLKPRTSLLASTASSDWLGDLVPEHEASAIHQAAKAAATDWFRGVHDLVRHDVEDLGIQARGAAQVWAGAFAPQSEVFEAGFIQQASKLAGFKLADKDDDLDDDDPDDDNQYDRSKDASRKVGMDQATLERRLTNSGWTMKDFEDEDIEAVLNGTMDYAALIQQDGNEDWGGGGGSSSEMYDDPNYDLGGFDASKRTAADDPGSDFEYIDHGDMHPDHHKQSGDPNDEKFSDGWANMANRRTAVDGRAKQAATLTPVNELKAGDVLLIDPNGTPDPANNTVQGVDGVPGMWIIDFTNGQSTPPLGNGSVYVASRKTAASESALRKRAADDGGQTCSTCGDAIEKNDGEDGYHHDNGEKHDHEAMPGNDKTALFVPLPPDVAASRPWSRGESWSLTCPICGKTETGNDYYNGWPSQDAFHNHLFCGHIPGTDYRQDLAIDRYSRRTAMRKHAMSIEATELELYMMNDADTYRQAYVPVVKNLQKFKAKGNFDRDQAVKGMCYAVDTAAKNYNQEHGSGESGRLPDIFPKSVRMEVAASLVDDLMGEWDLGNYISTRKEADVVHSIEPDDINSTFKQITPENADDDDENLGWIEASVGKRRWIGSADDFKLMARLLDKRSDLVHPDGEEDKLLNGELPVVTVDARDDTNMGWIADGDPDAEDDVTDSHGNIDTTRAASRKTAARAVTQFTVCAAHKGYFAGMDRSRKAEFFCEGGPGYGGPCDGEGCSFKPGTDLFEPSICDGTHSTVTGEFAWGVNRGRTASKRIQATIDDPQHVWTLSPDDEDWIGNFSDEAIQSNYDFWSGPQGAAAQPNLPGYADSMLKMVTDEQKRRHSSRTARWNHTSALSNASYTEDDTDLFG